MSSTPDTRVTRRGNPLAAASKVTSEKVSYRVGRRKASPTER
jgi:hypothetical protein